MKIKILLKYFFLIFLIVSFKFSAANDDKRLESIQILQSSELALKKLIANEEMLNLKTFIRF